MGTAIKVGSFPHQYPTPTFDTGSPGVRNFVVDCDAAAFHDIKINVPPNPSRVVLAPEEFLTGITVCFDSAAVWSITLHSNVKQPPDGYGPYGPQKGTCLTLPLENGQIVGFFGHSSGNYVDGIGVYVEHNK
ncbi:protein GOS9 [Elaeis guineensis]|uniref:Mannose/glucose-specific lectin n=1 Tax=Elaeis guineensis var. tenera TaxID=51953 RepID=A0A6I9RVG9_ELAGV|nr:mannose/glucose-specific lectin [Elaeis guineensis]